MSDDSPSKLGAERTKGADRQPPKRTFKERIESKNTRHQGDLEAKP
jgi:hypothetical protein